MPADSSGDPFDTVVFLAGSPNRIAVLDALSALGPVSRPDLVDAVAVSRVTVSRILEGFVERGWATREGTEYRVTPVGEVIGEAFGSLLRTVESMDRLSKVYPFLPPDFDVDVRRLADAQITVPTWSDSVAPVRRAAQVTEGLEVLRVCASGVAPDVIEGIRDAAVEDGADVEVVMTENALDLVRDDHTMRGWFDDLLRGGGRVYEHPGHPYLIGVCDRVAFIGANDDSGVPRGAVESSDVAVLDWVNSTIDRCREEAEPVEEGAFSG
jgi:predicted transcriptional regulator